VKGFMPRAIVTYVRAFLTMLVVVAGCEGKQPASSPPPARKDAAVAIAVMVSDAPVNSNAGTGEPAPRKPAAFNLREAALPKRTPCKADCSERYPSVKATACFRSAQEHEDMPTRPADIMLQGESKYRPEDHSCIAKSLVIDCCPFKPNDYKGIALKLGWANANAEERKAIGWVMARVIFGGTIIDEDYGRDVPKDLSMPEAHEEKPGLVLDYWVIPDGADAQFVHQQLKIGASGNVAIKALESVKGTLYEPVP
jgi:hypothetical protein